MVFLFLYIFASVKCNCLALNPVMYILYGFHVCECFDVFFFLLYECFWEDFYTKGSRKWI